LSFWSGSRDLKPDLLHLKQIIDCLGTMLNYNKTLDGMRFELRGALLAACLERKVLREERQHYLLHSVDDVVGMIPVVDLEGSRNAVTVQDPA